MTIGELQKLNILEVVNAGEEPDRELKSVFCCDLLSVAMGKGQEDAVWVTVMGNINTLAVMSLTDMACIVLAEGAVMDEAGMTKARQQGIPIFRTENPIFETALQLYRWIKEDAGAISAEGIGAGTS